MGVLYFCFRNLPIQIHTQNKPIFYKLIKEYNIVYKTSDNKKLCWTIFLIEGIKQHRKHLLKAVYMAKATLEINQTESLLDLHKIQFPPLRSVEGSPLGFPVVGDHSGLRLGRSLFHSLAFASWKKV